MLGVARIVLDDLDAQITVGQSKLNVLGPLGQTDPAALKIVVKADRVELILVLDPIQVKRLFVAGVELTETGTYGAVGSGARHELACISGWGQLKVGGSGFTVLVK